MGEPKILFAEPTPPLPPCCVVSGPPGFPDPPAPPPPPAAYRPTGLVPPEFPCDGLVGGLFPVPPVGLSPPPPPPEPPEPAATPTGVAEPPLPPPVEVIGDGEFSKIESVPETLTAPPPPTVTVIELAGIVNFVPPGKEVR